MASQRSAIVADDAQEPSELELNHVQNPNS